MKRENGWAKEWAELCRGKWPGLIRHETLPAEAKEEDWTRSASSPVYLAVRSFIHTDPQSVRHL